MGQSNLGGANRAMDPVTLTVGAIVSLILNTALEKTTEKLTEAGLEKLNQLRQTVFERH
ncbi:hypothetical protein [Prochlorothrix hollandica]|uniref:hypothetical protein n=1 Tax=Prochlorothrix hollandica TaxID=1223 RepID=UPI00034677BD|nr:hypothetical protein [Prochlorothrix hollandica]